MATATELTEYIAQMERALYSGVLTVRHGDTQTTFRSVEELKAALAEAKKQLNVLQGKRRKPRYIRQPGKGETC